MHNEEQKLCFMQSWSRIHAKTINKIDKHANLTTIYPNLGESSIMEAWGSIICEKFDIIPMLHKTYYHTKKNIEEKTREYAIYGGSNKPTTEKHMNAQTF